MQKTIKYGESYLTIDTQGGKIVELVLQGKKILGTYQRIDGKVGATHVCTPNFAGEGMAEFGLPFHGPARNLEWKVVSESENMIEIKVLLEALEKYKYALEVRQIFTLVDSLTKVRVYEDTKDYETRDLSTPAQESEQGVPDGKIGTSEMTQKQSHSEMNSALSRHLEQSRDLPDRQAGIPCFIQEVHVKNIGDHAVPVNIGIHNYFDTPNGWQEAELNGKNIKAEIENNLSVPLPLITKHKAEFMVSEAETMAISNISSHHPCENEDPTTDLSDSGVAPLPRMTNGSNTNIPATWNLEFACPDSVGRTRLSRYNRGNLFRIATQGASEMVTWSGVKDGKYDDKYACVEPVCWFDAKFFGTPPSLLNPGETRILKQEMGAL